MINLKLILKNQAPNSWMIKELTNMFFKKNDNDMILKMKQNKKNFQTKIKDLERKIDEWSKSQNVSLEQTDRTDPPPPPPQAHTEHGNAVFTESRKSNDSLKIQKDPPPPIIVNNKIEKDKPIKTSKKGYYVVETKEYPFSPELVLDHQLPDRSECNPLSSGISFHEQRDLSSLALGTSSGSGKSSLAVGMPCAFYYQQSSLKLNALAVIKFPE
nr:hypothetical protein [Tanacetum cinerariifolium]